MSLNFDNNKVFYYLQSRFSQKDISHDYSAHTRYTLTTRKDRRGGPRYILFGWRSDLKDCTSKWQ